MHVTGLVQPMPVEMFVGMQRHSAAQNAWTLVYNYKQDNHCE